MKGWGPKSSVCPSQPRESNFFSGISRDLAGISRKRPKSLRKKCLASILAPIFKSKLELFREFESFLESQNVAPTFSTFLSPAERLLEYPVHVPK